MNKLRRVVVTGIGVVAPNAVGVEEYFGQLMGAKCGLHQVCPDGLSKSCAKIAGQISISNDPDETRYAALAKRAAVEALERAQFDTTKREIGISFGTAVASTKEVDGNFVGASTVSPEHLRFGEATLCIAASLLIRGPQFTIGTGCVAGIDAFGIAFDQIRLGRCNAMLVCAADAPITPVVFAAFDQIGALSRCSDATIASRPFDSRRDGFVLSEGGAAIVLEEHDEALSRGIKPIAEAIEWASLCSAFHMTSMRTDGSDLRMLIDLLLSRSGRALDEIDLVDVHGTSTKINDEAEANAILSVFGQRTHGLYVSAQKAITGHSLGASNLIELVGLCCMLNHGVVPALRRDIEIEERLSMFFRKSTRKPVALRNAIKLSSSFSGIHSGVIVSAAQVHS